MVSDIGKLIGSKIKVIRNQKEMSQEQLALRADVNKSFMGQIERGEKSPTIKTLEKIVQALGITFEELFSFDKPLANSSKEPELIDKLETMLEGRTQKQRATAVKLLKTFFLFVDTE